MSDKLDLLAEVNTTVFVDRNYTQESLAKSIVDGTLSLDELGYLSLLHNDSTWSSESKNCIVDEEMTSAVSLKSKEEVEKLKDSDEYFENTQCPISDDERILLVQTFMVWTSMDPEVKIDDSGEVSDWTDDEMLRELDVVKSFIKHDLNTTLNLTGIMAEINMAMFSRDLDKFSEEELMGYAIMFHMDFSYLDDLQTQLFTSAAEIDEDETDKIILDALKSLIIDRKIWMLERLRLWRWREEVFIGRIYDTFELYPGIEILMDFETTAELLELGMSNYFLRVGEAKRETLMARYDFFDLYHMAGILSKGIQKGVTFDTEMQYEDLADTVLMLIDELELNPFHILTPLGVQIIRNREDSEFLYNLNKNRLVDTSGDLQLACTHAGIDLVRINKVVGDTGEMVEEIKQIPSKVLIDMLTCQYLSPQFYISIESHREYLGAVSSFTTLNGTRVTNAREGELIFYGIGDGTSQYRVYTILELAFTFDEYKDFVDPYSIAKYPEEPEVWSKFSHQSIKRFMSLILPRLKVKARGLRNETLNASIDLLESSIISIAKGSSSMLADLDPILRQERIISTLRNISWDIKSPLMGFLSFMFMTGVQLSDWDEFTRIDEFSVSVGMLDPAWKRVDPETVIGLTNKIFMMFTKEFESYIHVIGSDGKDYAEFIKSLRLVRYYDDDYQIDWSDELSTIGGHVYRLILANNLSLYHAVKMAGNWLMASANYYAIRIFDQAIGDNEIQLIESSFDAAISDF